MARGTVLREQLAAAGEIAPLGCVLDVCHESADLLVGEDLAPDGHVLVGPAAGDGIDGVGQ